MALGLHTTTTYKIEYGRKAASGSDEVSEFLNELRKYPEVYIEENETYVEIPFPILHELRKSEKWGATAEIIWEDSDKSNAEAHLEIW